MKEKNFVAKLKIKIGVLIQIFYRWSFENQAGVLGNLLLFRRWELEIIIF